MLFYEGKVIKQPSFYYKIDPTLVSHDPKMGLTRLIIGFMAAEQSYTQQVG